MQDSSIAGAGLRPPHSCSGESPFITTYECRFSLVPYIGLELWLHCCYLTMLCSNPVYHAMADHYVVLTTIISELLLFVLPS